MTDTSYIINKEIPTSLNTVLDDSNDIVAIGNGNGDKLFTNTFPGVVKSKEQIADNTPFSKSTSPVIPGMAAIFDTNPIPAIMASGNMGALRATKYRALHTAPDKVVFSLTGSAPTPTGSDIANSAGGNLTSSDFAIRDTAAHRFIIPVAGWKNNVIHISTDNGFTSTLNVALFGVMSGGVVAGKLLSFDIPANTAVNLGMGAGSVGVGGVVGEAIAKMGSWYDVQAINSGFNQLSLFITATTAPTAGNITGITVVRTS